MAEPRAPEELRIRYVPLDTLVRWDANPKRHDLPQLIALIRRYGFKDPPRWEPALNGGAGGIVEGNGRTDAAMSFRRGASKRSASLVPGAQPSHRADRPDVRYTGEKRRRRSVWDIPIALYRGAHYAVMPEDLAEVCILASTKPGDMVLDPFGGTGTVGRVADRLGRSATLVELNPEYIDLQEQRLNGVQREMIDLR